MTGAKLASVRAEADERAVVRLTFNFSNDWHRSMAFPPNASPREIINELRGLIGGLEYDIGRSRFDR